LNERITNIVNIGLKGLNGQNMRQGILRFDHEFCQTCVTSWIIQELRGNVLKKQISTKCMKCQKLFNHSTIFKKLPLESQNLINKVFLDRYLINTGEFKNAQIRSVTLLDSQF